MTAEEKGLLGAKYYAENPLYPLAKTLADINMDGVNQWGRTSDVTVIGLGNSTLDDVLRDLATAAGSARFVPIPSRRRGTSTARIISSSPRRACPRSTPGTASSTSASRPDFAEEKRAEYLANDYHKVSDEIKPGWDLSGGVEDLRLLFEVGRRVADGTTWPEWKPGTEFKAAREASLKH